MIGSKARWIYFIVRLLKNFESDSKSFIIYHAETRIASAFLFFRSFFLKKKKLYDIIKNINSLAEEENACIARIF